MTRFSSSVAFPWSAERGETLQRRMHEVFRTLQHPSLENAVRDAETLHRFAIRPAHHGVMLWLYRDGWKILHPYSSQEVAEDYLFSKLPKIESTPGDINRKPPQPPSVIWEGY